MRYFRDDLTLDLKDVQCLNFQNHLMKKIVIKNYDKNFRCTLYQNNYMKFEIYYACGKIYTLLYSCRRYDVSPRNK